MKFRLLSRLVLSCVLMLGLAVPAWAEQAARAASQQNVRVTGVVRDESNAITLPGIPVEVVGANQTVYTDVDGRFVLDLAPGAYQLKVVMEGYEEKSLTLDVPAGGRNVTADVGLTMARFAETVTVTAAAPLNAITSSQEVQLIERRNAQVITDNMGAQEMRANGDSDAAAAMSRVTGLSVVDNQYVFVRGLGERYSNTTLAGSVLPTTEPDKKVVPLDLFPAGLLDSIQVNKSYSPDRSAEFAGGLVQIMPLKFPGRPVLDFSYGLNFFSTATGKSIPMSPLDGNDVFGFDRGVRALPSIIPNSKIVRRGIYTPTVGYSPEEITAFGRALDQSRWTPALADGAPGQNWGAVFGNRFGKLGVVASVTHAYKEQYVEEQRAFYRVGEGSELEAVSDYDMQYGMQKAQVGVVANLAYQFTPNHRVSLENFYSHSGRDEGRIFEGPNTENNFYYRNYRLQYIEEGLMSNGVTGEHFFQGLSNSRLDWRFASARARRDEPDLRETLYQSTFRSGTLESSGNFLLADESQSGFRLFNDLADETLDAAVNWSVFSTAGARPTQYKFGLNYVERTRDFQSRRFRYIPIVANKDASVGINLSLTPEEIYAPQNIGTVFRFNEETRPVDAYDGEQTTTAGYGMIDISLTPRTRLIAGARVERFEQVVNTFDPFGLFERTISSGIENTDIFPAINFVQALTGSSNLRLSYSSTVNRPEFRELAAFEFTDVVGSRAVRGNPELDRALIHNVDGRWELFTGGRGILAASLFYKNFDQPIERVVIAGAQPIVTYQNADTARNYGLELEAGRQLFDGMFVNANYTYVDSQISLRPEQRTVQTSLERPLAGQSKNLFNLMAEYTNRGFSSRVLYNFFGDRISDVGSNQAPDIIEQGRGSLDLVVGQRIGRFSVRFTVENLTDSEYLFTQGSEDQRVFKLGRTLGLSVGLNIF
ncbi:MAG TPA: TonB-dependent receptor [Vicinamibacterales bacterium]|nr:TonB-dependent receptor [Vicinamibacterales bacterium]